MKLSLSIYSLQQAFEAQQMDLCGFVAFARDLGVDAVDLGYYWQDEERQIPEVREWVREAGLDVSSYIASNNFAMTGEGELQGEIQKVKHAIDNAVRIEADAVRVFAGKTREGTFETHRGQVVSALRECVAHARTRGVKLALEDHGGIGATSAHLLYYKGEIDDDHFGFLVDFANFTASGGEAALAAVRRVAPHALLVHAKDGILEADGTWIPTLCGAGAIPMEACLGALAEAGYQGDVSLEYEVPVDYAVGIPHDVAHLKRILTRLGCLESESETPVGAPSATRE